MKYALIATNKQGAILTFRSETIKGAIQQFKNEYYTKGWIINVRCNESGDTIRTLKSTFR
jgi:hypothetical protein